MTEPYTKPMIQHDIVQDIIKGEYLQTGLLSERQLMEKYGVSKSIVREALVDARSPYNGKRLNEIGLPKGMIIVTVVRDGEAIIPDGETVLNADDNVVILGNECDLPQVLSNIRGERI